MMRPLWEGWPLPAPDGGLVSRRITKCARNPRGLTGRQYAAHLDLIGWPYWTYLAVSPCERFVKIGRSYRPVFRVHEGCDIRAFEAEHGLGRSVLIRAYPGEKELEPKCHAFMAPDRVRGEWFRVGPRFRVLLNRLDREFQGVHLERVEDEDDL